MPSSETAAEEPQQMEETVYWVASGEVYHSTSNYATI